MTKKIFSFLSIFGTIILIAQNNTFYGTYRSKNGSFLKLNFDNTFYYQKKTTTIQDVISLDVEGYSFGKFRREKNFLRLNTFLSKKNIDSLINNNIELKEYNIEKRSKDSIEVKLNLKNSNLKIFMCGAGVELLYNKKDISGCYLLQEKNILPIFTSKDFYFQIFPNIDNSLVRSEYKINTLFFTTKKFSKSINSDLEINIDFDPNNFSFLFFKGEYVMINGNKLSFLDEIFYKE